MFIIALILLAAATGILITLTIIDLRTWLLPNPLNLLLAITGITFHAVTNFEILSKEELLIGAAIGAGLPYLIRLGGNAYYKQESLGLGDVKLLGAAGFWLGPLGVIYAIVLGAAAGVVHGIIYATIQSKKNKTPFSLKRLVYPAGPGFCAGIFISGVYLFYHYIGANL